MCASASASASTLDAPDRAAARAAVESMCERLLVNPVIEAYEIELTELAPVS